MDRTIDSNRDFMNLNFIYVCFFLKNFPIAYKKSPDILLFIVTLQLDHDLSSYTTFVVCVNLYK